MQRDLAGPCLQNINLGLAPTSQCPMLRIMLPQFGDYVAFKLDPVASLKALDDPEVTKACEALQSDKTYVSCVTYVCCLAV